VRQPFTCSYWSGGTENCLSSVPCSSLAWNICCFFLTANPRPLAVPDTTLKQEGVGLVVINVGRAVTFSVEFNQCDMQGNVFSANPLFTKTITLRYKYDKDWFSPVESLL